MRLAGAVNCVLSSNHRKSLSSKEIGVSCFRSTPFSTASQPLAARILRRKFAHSLNDARISNGRNGLLDPLHMDLMIPVVAEVESNGTAVETMSARSKFSLGFNRRTKSSSY